MSENYREPREPIIKSDSYRAGELSTSMYNRGGMVAGVGVATVREGDSGSTIRDTIRNIGLGDAG